MFVIEQLITICGETQFAGVPCALVRFAGCPLRCSWCDTTYAYEGGQALSLEQVLRWVEKSQMKLVLLTGGEPLLQPELPKLASTLAERGHQVLVETSGALDISSLPPPIVRSVDIKCPGSGQVKRNLWSNLRQLRPGDAVKLVVSSRVDYDWAKEVIARHQLEPPLVVLLSAAARQLRLDQLAGWILEDRLQGLRLNVQLHRTIWSGPEGVRDL